jgi:hypothetical protein
MTTSQPSLVPGAGAPPWQERQLGYWLKLLVLFGFALLTLTALISGGAWVAIVPGMLIQGPGPRDTIGEMLTAGLLLTGVLAVSVFGLIKLYSYVSAPNRFTPSYGQIAPTLAGQPFEVRFQRPRWSRSFRGKGTLRFEPEQLVLDGTLEPSALFQLGIVVVVTLAPLLVFGVGLGLLPALLLAFLLGKKKRSRTAPYASISDLMVRGCRTSFTSPGDAPNKVALYVSQVDGERLYRELAQRFPAALGGWVAN